MASEKVELSTPEKLSDLFSGLSVKTLANLRSAGRGPRYFRRGRRIFYRIDDVRLWITESEVLTIDQKGTRRAESNK